MQEAEAGEQRKRAEQMQAAAVSQTEKFVGEQDAVRVAADKATSQAKARLAEAHAALEAQHANVCKLKVSSGPAPCQYTGKVFLNVLFLEAWGV